MAKRALLVGINDYPGTQNDLQGCVNDITNVYDVLVKYFGYASTDVSMLQDKRATRTAILAALRKLVSSCAEGDRFVFHFSGHGSQIRDTEGDELSDGMDEILCPYDFDWDGEFIKDDDLASILGEVKKGVSAEIILDSCHSGTGTREIVLDRQSLAATMAGLADVRALWSSKHCIRPKYLAPPADIALRADDVYGESLRVRRIGERAAPQHVLWAACKADQYSADADVGGKPGGAFTYFFCKHIRDTEGSISRAELLKRVRASLKHEGFSQFPQLECAASRKTQAVFD
jgi:metacaspase-1